jgi:HPt (histidine-containing phosphotransfer) domain-containing protein
MMTDQENQQPTFQYSVKISQTAKGAATVDVHVFSNNLEAARVQAVQQYAQCIEDLKSKGLTVAMDKGGKTD